MTDRQPVSKNLTLLRSCIYMVVFALSTVIYCFVMVASNALPIKWRYVLVRRYAWFQVNSLSLICGLKYSVEGREHLPNEPSIIFSKHQSTFETFVLLYEMPDCCFIAKRELLWIPFFGWGMAALSFITIDRAKGRKAIEQIIAQARDRFSRGLWVTIFPEGTRKDPGETPDYKIGGPILAAETGRKVVPLVHNAGEFWPRHSLCKWPGTVTFRIGPAIESEGRKPNDILEDAKHYIETEYQTMHVPNRFPK